MRISESASQSADRPADHPSNPVIPESAGRAADRLKAVLCNPTGFILFYIAVMGYFIGMHASKRIPALFFIGVFGGLSVLIVAFATRQKADPIRPQPNAMKTSWKPVLSILVFMTAAWVSPAILHAISARPHVWTLVAWGAATGAIVAAILTMTKLSVYPQPQQLDHGFEAYLRIYEARMQDARTADAPKSETRDARTVDARTADARKSETRESDVDLQCLAVMYAANAVPTGFAVNVDQLHGFIDADEGEIQNSINRLCDAGMINVEKNPAAFTEKGRSRDLGWIVAT